MGIATLRRYHNVKNNPTKAADVDVMSEPKPAPKPVVSEEWLKFEFVPEETHTPEPEESKVEVQTEEPKRKGGRPKGSKNKKTLENIIGK